MPDAVESVLKEEDSMSRKCSHELYIILLDTRREHTLTTDSWRHATASRVLVTGGLGFIGKHLCKKLLELDLQVMCLDDESSSTDDARDFICASAREKGQLIEFVCGSILDHGLVSRLVQSGIGVVFHLGAKLGVKNIIDNQLEAIETNVIGTHNVLEAAFDAKAPVFIASSSEVYGKGQKMPFKEDMDLALGSTSIARWSYAGSKILDEFEALAYWKENRLPVVVGRFFNIVGPGQSPGSGMVIPKMVEAALEGRPLEVLGNGQQRRCFCHVDDCVDAMLELMISQKSSDNYGQVFNIGNPKNEISMMDLAVKITSATQSASEIKVIPYSDAYEPGTFEDMLKRLPSIEKIEHATSWTPTRSLDTIISDVVAVFRSK